MATIDSRTAPRQAAPNVMVRVSTAERFRSAYLRDLSEGGLFIKTDKPLPIGREVVIDLLPPGFTVPLRLAAIVVHHGDGTSGGMGVKLQELEAQTQLALRALIASYQQAVVPPHIPGRPEGDATRDLETLLEQYANLKTTLETRDTELTTERQRHAEASHRAVKLADELEALRGNPGQAPGTTASEELRALVANKDLELAEARTRISKLEEGVETFRSEVQVLEEDDANSRRLAGALAQEKLGLAKEAEQLATELRQERQTAQDGLRELEERMQMSDHVAKELIHSMQADLDARQMAVDSQGGRAAELEAQLAEQILRQATFDTELRSLRGENAALASKLHQAEQAVTDAARRLDRQKIKERELRALLAAVSGRGEAPRAEDDEVVFEEVPVGPSPPGAPPPPPPVELPPIDWAVPPAGQPPVEESLPQEFDVDEEPIEVDEEPSAPQPTIPALSMADFEKRVRANAELKKGPGFDDHQSSDEVVNKVKGLLEAAGRFTELMVLGRGVVTPPELLEVLYKLHVAGVITFL